MKKQKLLSLLLAVTMVLAMIPAFVVSTAAVVDLPTQIDLSTYEDGDTVKINGEDYLVIKTTTGVITGTLDGKYILGADLDFNGDSSDLTVISPIKLKGGIFNGNGHSMTGYKVTTNYAGTFAMHSASVPTADITICNLTLGREDEPIEVTQAQHGGALFGFCQAAVNFTVENVTAYANITTTGSNKRVGGLIGSIKNGTLEIKNSVYDGTLQTSTSGEAGGILGRNEGEVVTLTNCTVKGEINSNNFAGGMIAYITTSGKSNTLVSCLNIAAVSSSAVATLGGLVGSKSGGTLELVDCANVGVVAAGGGSLLGGDPEADGSSLIITNTKSITVDKFEEEKTWLETTFPGFVFDNTGSAIVVNPVEPTIPAEARYLQYQYNKNENGETESMDIRIIGVFNGEDTEENKAKYQNLGFDLTFKNTPSGDVKDSVKTNKVYTSIQAKAENGSGMQTFSAEDLGGKYIYAVVLRNIPMEGNFVIDVQAFATPTEGEVQYDNTVTITIDNGVIQ